MTSAICFVIYLVIGAITSFVWALATDDGFEEAMCAGAFWVIVIPALILNSLIYIIFIAPALAAQKIKESKENKK